MNRLIAGCGIILFCFFFPGSVLAEYVLPYPSYMPGNKLYRLSRLSDRLKRYWYFGNISAYKYHLSLSDKYLVEAKTLFAYKQYLLAVDALARSDREFLEAPKYLIAARSQEKDMHAFTEQFTQAADVHVLTLKDIGEDVPPTFVWRPEKSSAIQLPLSVTIGESVEIRKQAIETVR